MEKDTSVPNLVSGEVSDQKGEVLVEKGGVLDGEETRVSGGVGEEGSPKVESLDLEIRVSGDSGGEEDHKVETLVPETRVSGDGGGGEDEDHKVETLVPETKVLDEEKSVEDRKEENLVERSDGISGEEGSVEKPIGGGKDESLVEKPIEISKDEAVIDETSAENPIEVKREEFPVEKRSDVSKEEPLEGNSVQSTEVEKTSVEKPNDGNEEESLVENEIESKKEQSLDGSSVKEEENLAKSPNEVDKEEVLAEKPTETSTEKPIDANEQSSLVENPTDANKEESLSEVLVEAEKQPFVDKQNDVSIEQKNLAENTSEASKEEKNLAENTSEASKEEENVAENTSEVSKEEEAIVENPIGVTDVENSSTENPNNAGKEGYVAESPIKVNSEEASFDSEEVVADGVTNDSVEKAIVPTEDKNLSEATSVVEKSVDPEPAAAEAENDQNEKPHHSQSNGSISEIEKDETFNAPMAPVDSSLEEKPTPAANDGGMESKSKDVELLDVVKDVKDMPHTSSSANNSDSISEENPGLVEVEKLEDKEVLDISSTENLKESTTEGDAVEDLDEANKKDVVPKVGLEVAATLGTSDTAKQIPQEVDGDSPSASSGVGSSRDFSNQLDGQILSDFDEDGETDDEDDGKELFDSAALAALLRAASTASSDGNVTISASDAARIFSVDRPAGLGSSVPSLRPAPARQLRPNLFGPSEIAVTGEAENNMTEEEKKLHDKVEQIRVKFLRLVHRLGHSPEDTVASQVLYRLGLAEGIKRGRQTSRAFSLDSAKKKALQLEEAGQEDLDFSCNILVLGKSGVGKSATINSIFGEQVTTTNAFRRTTNSVKEIVGMVDGVKVRFIDTPGLNPSVMDQGANRKILSSIKSYTKKCPPDIVLYVDRLDTQTRDFNDLPLLRSVASMLGSSIWFNAIVALTHSACAPPDGPNGTSLGYDVFVAQRSHVVQHSIRQAAGDMRLMNPVALVENHPSCRRNREGERVLPNGTSWRPQLLLLCYSSKTLSEANALLKIQDPSPGKLFGFRVRSPPLPYLLSSLLQSRQHPKVANDQGDNGDSDIDLDDLSDSDQEEDEYDQLPPFKPLKKSQMAKLTKEQRNAYLDEYEYRVKLLQKKQWKDELRRLKEMKKRGKSSQNDVGYGEMPEDYDQDAAPATIAVPMPDMVLPPSFDCDNSSYRYRFLEPTSQLLTRPVLDSQGWDHDCGYDGVSLEQNLALAGRFPTGVAVQITKDKKDFSIHLDSSIAAKHGENGSTLAGFDIQSIGRQLAYIVRSESKFKTLKKNKTAAGITMTFLGENVATGVKLEDQLLVGNRVSLVASTGAIRSQGDMAYGANLEAKLREKDYPIGQDLTTLGLSLMKWRGDLAVGANLQSQFSIGRKSKMTVRLGLNNKRTGQISIRTSSSEQLQIALLGILPLALSIYRNIWPGESYLVQ